MKELTNLELLMEYMEQNQYFIGNDLLGKYNELLQKEEAKQLTLGDVSQQRELLEFFITWYNAKPKAKKGELIYVNDIIEFLKL